RGFEVFTLRVKVEGLARIVPSHCFNCYGRVRRHRTRLIVPVLEKESEARRHIGFSDGDFNKAVTEVHAEAVVWSAFDLPTVMRVSADKMRLAAAFAANVLNYIVDAERLNDMVKGESQSPACDPRQPAANPAAQPDAAPSDQAVGGEQHGKAEACKHYRVQSRHSHCLGCFVVEARSV